MSVASRTRPLRSLRFRSKHLAVVVSIKGEVCGDACGSERSTRNTVERECECRRITDTDVHLFTHVELLTLSRSHQSSEDAFAVNGGSHPAVARRSNGQVYRRGSGAVARTSGRGRPGWRRRGL